MIDLKGRRIGITGATSGIGLALVRRLHAEGCRLLVHGRNPDKLEQLRSDLPLATFLADVREEDFAERFMNASIDQLGGCDVVINNAGVAWAGTIKDAQKDKIPELVATNVEAPFQLSYRAVAYFRSVNAGHLINITSVVGLKPRIYSGIYAGTKHALEALSDSLRQELARTPVQVTCIEPGMVLTQLHRDFEEHPMNAMQISTPLTADDVAEAVIFAMTRPAHVSVANLVLLPRDQKT